MVKRAPNSIPQRGKDGNLNLKLLQTHSLTVENWNFKLRLDLTGYFATLISKLGMQLITCISPFRLFTASSIRISFLDTFSFYTHAEGQNQVEILMSSTYFDS